jgi:hypothetical protein
MNQPCGCEDEVWGWSEGPIRGQDVLTTLCGQHMSILNNGGKQQQPGMRMQQGQIPTTIGGIPLNPFFQHQMGGFGPPFQMPHPGVRVQMPPSGRGR